MPKVSGTREWSTQSANCLIGCSHACRYCYARYNAVHRYGYVKPGSWNKPRPRPAAVRKKWPHVEGTVMFPTTHDILPEFLAECLACLKNILSPGNRVLIVSKPHLKVIYALCRELREHQERILFRFTIGADDDELLRYWEPGAPSFRQRFASLQVAHKWGWQTSVSIEPMLDSPNITRLVEALAPYITDSIWIGKMNGIGQRVEVRTKEDRREVARIEAGQTNTRIREIYNGLKDHPLAKWKESIKEVVGLELATAPGLDV